MAATTNGSIIECSIFIGFTRLMICRFIIYDFPVGKRVVHVPAATAATADAEDVATDIGNDDLA